MPKSKSRRKPHSSSQRRVVRKPAILDRLEVSDASLKRIMEMNRLSVMRFQLGTAEVNDTCALFTLLSVSQLLTKNFEEGPELRRMFAQAVVLLANFNKGGNLTPGDRASVVDAFEVALELWGKCSVEEVVRASRAIREGKYDVDELFLSALKEDDLTDAAKTQAAQETFPA